MSNDVPAPERPAAVLRNRWGLRILLVLFLAVGVPVGATVLYHFPPTKPNRFYPGCTFYWLTGWHCAGCGATRCVYSLLHGNLEQAFAYNALFVLLLPLIAYAGFRILFEIWTGRKAPGIRVPRWIIGVFIGLVVAFWIARNIDVYPLTLLAPHELK
jgi:hypothetical protein